MTASEILVAVGLLGSVLAWLVVRLEKTTSRLERVSYHQGQLDTKVDTLWAFQMRRAQSEMVKIGWGEAHSPVHINATGLAAVAPFLDMFLPFYAGLLASDPNISEQDMFVAFEQKFGDYILQKICIPNGLTSGSCLLAIMDSCKIQTRACP